MGTEMKEVAVFKGQITRLENQAREVNIETKEDYASAADLVAKLKDFGSRIKKTKESITKPLNEALKNARTLFAPIEEQFANAEDIIKCKLLDYKRKADAEAKAEEDKIAKKVESGRMKLETGEKKLDEIERIETTTQGKVGQVSVRKVKKIRITSAADLPREYLVPDLVAIRRDALGGKIIPGVEVYEEETIAAGSL